MASIEAIKCENYESLKSSNAKLINATSQIFKTN